MKRLLNLFLFVGIAHSCTVAQVSSKYATAISEESSKEHLTLLTSAEFAGRGTGQLGGVKTVNYISEQFKHYGLKPVVNGSYFQPLRLIQSSYKVESFSLGNNIPLILGKDYYVQGDNGFKKFEAADIVFVGYGIQAKAYNDLKGLDIKDKVVMLINEDEPLSENGNSRITGTRVKSEWTTNRFKRLQEIMKMNPKMILATGRKATEIIKEANDRNLLGSFRLDSNKQQQRSSRQPIPVVYITESIADALLKYNSTSLAQFRAETNSTFEPKSQKITLPVEASMGLKEENFADPNVLGLVEGTDLKNEIVVVCAHYDHDGQLPDGTFFPGADDNGSGTVAIMELAKAFAKAKEEGKGPRRSILFISLAAEERGLLGSKFYVENPILPLKNTVACINIDMIGRIDDKHLQGNHNYLHVIGADKLSTQLTPIVNNANKMYTKLELDYTYNDPKEPMRLYYRSDHYNFAEKGIPSVFFFSGLHSHYHTPEDTVDKINFPMMVKRTQLIFHVAWEVANRDQRLPVDVQ